MAGVNGSAHGCEEGWFEQETDKGGNVLLALQLWKGGHGGDEALSGKMCCSLIGVGTYW